MAIFKDEKLFDVNIVNEVQESFLEYSMSVIMQRALPDVRDGLKPVHRRIVYTMYENNLTPDSAYRKCADTVGSVLGRYHPHGDASVYDALVRMAQNFSLRYMLVDGHGNFGSVDGYPAAAYRYTEAKLSKISTALLEDIDKNTVDWRTNYDDRLMEPEVLPARFPNLLVNGSTGIAVGMATNIPPHNLGEVIDGMCYLIDNPDCQMEDLNGIIKGPDFPTGGIIMGMAGLRAAYATGKGKVHLRGRVEIEEKSDGKFRLVVTEIPYMINKQNLVKSINDLIDDKKIEGINDIIDYSNREGIRIEIDLKKDVSPQIVLNQLYKLTQLQVTVGIIMLALVNNQPKILTLKSMLQEYVAHQNEVVRRRTEFDLKKCQDRAHILKGLAIALDFIEEVIKILRASKTIAEGKEQLMARFELDDIQASAIVQMRLGQLTGLEKQKIEDELNELLTKINYFLELLADNTKLLEIVKTEAQKIRDRFNDDRRTEISPVSGEVDIIDLIPNDQSVLTLTSFGYIKRLTLDTYKTQNRGGRGIAGMTQREEDFAQHMFVCKSHDNIMFFTNLGKVYTLKAYEVPEGSRTSKGLNIVNILPLVGDEYITKMLKITEFEENHYLFMVTKQGVAKRVSLQRFSNVRKNGVICITLDDGDELNFVELTCGNSEIVIATKKGMSVRFLESGVREMGRGARGVRALRVAEGDVVVGMVEGDEQSMVLTISETGFGRRSPISDYRLTKRGSKGVINYRTANNGDVASIKIVNDDDDVIIINNDGVIIRIAANQININRRPSKGVRVMRLVDEQKIISIATILHDDEEEIAALPNLDEDGTDEIEDVELDIELEEEDIDTEDVDDDID